MVTKIWVNSGSGNVAWWHQAISWANTSKVHWQPPEGTFTRKKSAIKQGSWGHGGKGPGPLKIQWGLSEIFPEGPMDLPKLENWWYISMEGPFKFCLGPLEIQMVGAPDPEQKMSTESPGSITKLASEFLILSFIKSLGEQWVKWCIQVLTGRSLVSCYAYNGLEIMQIVVTASTANITKHWELNKLSGGGGGWGVLFLFEVSFWCRQTK